MSSTTAQPTLAPPTSSAATSTSSHTGVDNAPTPSEALQAPDISSPHQLIDWVDTVLGQLETRFDDMNGQVSARMNEMSNRIDALESSIQGKYQQQQSKQVLERVTNYRHDQRRRIQI